MEKLSHSPETNLQALQDQMHEAFSSWGAAHAINNGNRIMVLPYDTTAFPEQAITQPKTELSTSLEMPDALMQQMVTGNLALVMGSLERAQQFIGEVTELGQAIHQLTQNGKNVATIYAHCNLADIGIGSGGKVAAIGKTSHLEHSAGMLSKLMSREALVLKDGRDQQTIHSIPISKMASKVGAVYYVIPDSQNAIKYGLSETISHKVNTLGLRALMSDMRSKGVDLNLVLAGSQLSYFKNEGNEIYEAMIKKPPQGAADVLSKFDYYVTLPMWQDTRTGQWSWRVNKLTRVPDMFQATTKDARQQQAMSLANHIQSSLACDIEALSGIPTIYEGLEMFQQTESKPVDLVSARLGQIAAASQAGAHLKN